MENELYERPLAYRLMPKKLEDIVGQQHLVGPNGYIYRMIKSNKMASIILYGKPGIGKTTIANVICNELNVPHGIFNASNDNKQTLTKLVNEGKNYPKYILIIDEIHRMKKDIQDYLLPHVENGNIIMIGITTVNPYHSINPAIRSRCLVFRLNDLTNNDLNQIIDKAIKSINPEITIDNEARNYLISNADGEVRTLINFVENTCIIANKNNITVDDCKIVVQKAAINMDNGQDSFYNNLSGLHKSLRGSDVDASLHYLAQLLISEDLVAITRRLKMVAYEDIGLANPSMGPKVKAACDVALEVGMPEAMIPLGAIVCDLALSPKSNSAYLAIAKAYEDIEKGNTGPLPPHLKNVYEFDNNKDKYLYPHDYPGAWVYQQYLPDKIKDVKYYIPKDSSKYEEALKERYLAIEKAKEKYKQSK
ncbi:MAG: replication-associated recombination protein A [Acholeplasmataceae bacterium]|nr:replication-associated recombination protein A [Acholeplasmataceae bacterium]